MEFFSKIFKKRETVENLLSSLMAKKEGFGEFSADLYYNDLGRKDERYVVKINHPEVNKESKRMRNVAYHFRCGNFVDALKRAHEMVDCLIATNSTNSPYISKKENIK